MANLNIKPLVKRMMEKLVIEAKLANTPILITQGLRTFEEQNELYKKGRRGIKGEKIVTNAKGGQSFHCWGVAFDICFLVGNKASYTGNWNKIGVLGEKLGLEWGGRWKSFPDRPHFSYTGGYKLSDFQKGLIDNKKFI